MDEPITPRRSERGVLILDGRKGKSDLPAARARLAIGLGLALGIGLLIWGGLNWASALADGPIRVGLYIQYEDGSTSTQCVELDGPDPTGLDALEQAGLNFIFEPGSLVGNAVCKIDETGCDYPAEDCFCQCPGTPCNYWTYWYAEDGAWKLSALGASNHAVHDGDLEGWVWGDGKMGPPAELLAQGICAAPGEPASVATQELSKVTPPPTAAIAAATPATSATSAESATRSAPSATEPLAASQASTPNPAPAAPAGESGGTGSSSYLLLVAGLTGLGTVLLGLAYWLTSRRS